MSEDGPAAGAAIGPFAELRAALEDQRAAIAERIEAVDQAEAALDRLRAAFSVPVPGPVERAQAPRDSPRG